MRQAHSSSTSFVAPSGVSESDAPANNKALDWYLKHRDDTALFPSDTTELSENSPQTAEAFGKSALCFDEIVDSWGIK